MTENRHDRRWPDPYAGGKWGGGKPRIVSRTQLAGRIVAVLTSKVERRGLELINPWTRCIPAGQVHELQLTDEADACPGGSADRTAAIAFMEFTVGGLVMGGDKVVVAGREIGTVAGFDETHMPNHLNILLFAPERRTGLEMGLKGGDPVTIQTGAER